jgi:hypothetical protein
MKRPRCDATAAVTRDVDTAMMNGALEGLLSPAGDVINQVASICDGYRQMKLSTGPSRSDNKSADDGTDLVI